MTRRGGASLGREVAPRQFAVALGNLATGWMRRLTEPDRQILLALRYILPSKNPRRRGGPIFRPSHPGVSDRGDGPTNFIPFRLNTIGAVLLPA